MKVLASALSADDMQTKRKLAALIMEKLLSSRGTDTGKIGLDMV